MLTGDNAAVAENVAQTLGLDKFFANLLPAQKVEKVEALMKDKSDGGKLILPATVLMMRRCWLWPILVLPWAALVLTRRLRRRTL